MLLLFLILFGFASYLLIGTTISVWFHNVAIEYIFSEEQKDESERWVLIVVILWPAALISYAILTLLEKTKSEKDGI